MNAENWLAEFREASLGSIGALFLEAMIKIDRLSPRGTGSSWNIAGSIDRQESVENLIK